ncbi:MAG TPA: hypothetical protein VF118_02765 [Gemmatimonadaceae bacterium]
MRIGRLAPLAFTLVALGTLPRDAAACVPLPGHHPIHDNTMAAYAWAAVTVVAVSATFLLARRRVGRLGWLPWTSLLLLAVQPAWTVSAITGDCGTMRLAGAALVATIAVALAGIQAILTLRSWWTSR